MGEQKENYGYLDNIRIKDGNQKCKDFFNDIYLNDRQKATDLLNEELLTFPCLFILMPLIKSFNLYNNLNYRNIMVLQITAEILNPKYYNNYLSEKDDNIHNYLKWIINTGYSENLPDDDYELILDVAVSVLINLYEDKSILPSVVEMVFMRNKDGRFINDLITSLFCLHDVNILKLIAERVASTDKNEAELACNLLNINQQNFNGEKKYDNAIKWIEENQPFLNFTGENHQFKSNPVFLSVDFLGKYLNKKFSSDDIQPVFLSNENECVKAFNALGDEEKEILAGYSLKIRSNNMTKWQEWINIPVSEQLKTAKAESEGSL